MCGGVAGQDYRLCCVLKVCAYSRHRIQSSSQALRPGMDIVRCGNTIDIESRLWSTTILFFHHVEKCGGKLSMFGHVCMCLLPCQMRCKSAWDIGSVGALVPAQLTYTPLFIPCHTGSGQTMKHIFLNKHYCLKPTLVDLFSFFFLSTK